MKKIKLFIVDDSATVRQTISKLIENENDIELLGVAADPLFAIKKFQTTGLPDVLILDIEMPRMDGITFLKQIMQENPISTIICSSCAKSGSLKAIEALQSGAVDIIEKPDLQTKAFLEKSKNILLSSIRSAALVRVKKVSNTSIKSNPKKDIQPLSTTINNKKIIAIGSSTGGVQVIEKILTSLKETVVPILITQHMPAGFTASLAKRLNNLSKLTIKQAEHGDKLVDSTVYIAPGNKHMTLKKEHTNFIINITDGPKVSHHRPSVDVLFRSVANSIGKNGIGIILTGMGNDGSHGMKEMFDVGAKTYAQDEQSCVVYGMPNEAKKLGGVCHSLSIEKIIEYIQSIR